MGAQRDTISAAIRDAATAGRPAVVSFMTAGFPDQAGFSEYWVGEHATLNWEAIPSPELVIAAAARQTWCNKGLCYHRPD